MSRRRLFALFAAAYRQAASLARSTTGGPLNRSARQEVGSGGSFRPRRFAPTVAAAVVVLGLGTATAFAAPNDAALFVQTATRGTFDDGRLTLRGVTRHVAWFTDRPARDSGVVSFAAFRRSLFSHGQPAPNAALDLSGSGPSGVVALELRRARYNARRGTVSYAAKRLRRLGGSRMEHLAGRLSKRPIPRRFGSASLFVDGGGGHSCAANLTNATSNVLLVTSSDKWNTDTWRVPSGYDPGGLTLNPTESRGWETNGGFLRGCSNAVTWNTIYGVTITVQTTDPWDGPNTLTCTTSDPRYTCKQGPGSVTGGSTILGNWQLYGP